MSKLESSVAEEISKDTCGMHCQKITEIKALIPAGRNISKSRLIKILWLIDDKFSEKTQSKNNTWKEETTKVGSLTGIIWEKGAIGPEIDKSEINETTIKTLLDFEITNQLKSGHICRDTTSLDSSEKNLVQNILNVWLNATWEELVLYTYKTCK